jgi:phosphotriesterase-related protein
VTGPVVQTVRGPIAARDLGTTLVHEHVLCDFIGAELTNPGRWNRDEVFAAMLPRLLALRRPGVTGFIDCTPAFIGRDAVLLRRLAEAADLHLLTNTGYYGAAQDKYLPSHALTESTEQLARRWTREFESGIEGSGIRPGFIKIGVDPGRLSAVDRKLVEAAALTHRRTGLTIACHTASGVAALEIIEVLEEGGVSAARYVCVHTDAEPDPNFHRKIAEPGAWVEYDSIGSRPIAHHVELVGSMLAAHPDRLLLSQDSGWWNAGEPHGGKIRDYTFLVGEFLPALRNAGVANSLLDKIMKENPSRAFSLAGVTH